MANFCTISRISHFEMYSYWKIINFGAVTWAASCHSYDSTSRRVLFLTYLLSPSHVLHFNITALQSSVMWQLQYIEHPALFWSKKPTESLSASVQLGQDLLQCSSAYCCLVHHQYRKGHYCRNDLQDDILRCLIFEHRRAVRQGEKEAHLGGFVEETRSAATVQEIVVLLYVTVRESLGQIKAKNKRGKNPHSDIMIG